MELDDTTKSEMGLVQLAAIRAILQAATASEILSLADAYGKTPLHYAAWNVHASAGHEILPELAEAYPRALAVADQEGRTPWHYLFLAAADEEVPLRVVQQLLDLTDPDRSALEQKDLLGETPRDILQRQKDEISNAKELLHLLKTPTTTDSI
uniref:Ankyrin repeat domain-containing protein n=1 Tax=Entomoneis paludosa TaxID=265537 RepID=A0A7S2YFS9_9STRA